MEKGQLNEELQKLRIAYQKLYEEKEHQHKSFNEEIKSVKKEL